MLKGSIVAGSNFAPARCIAPYRVTRQLVDKDWPMKLGLAFEADTPIRRG